MILTLAPAYIISSQYTLLSTYEVAGKNWMITSNIRTESN